MQPSQLQRRAAGHRTGSGRSVANGHRLVRPQQLEQPISLMLEHRLERRRECRTASQVNPARVASYAIHPKLVVEVGSGREPGRPYVADDLALGNVRAGMNAPGEPAKVPVAVNDGFSRFAPRKTPLAE